MRISDWSSDVCSSDLEKSASASGETSASSGVAKSRVPDSMTWRPGRNLSVAGLGVISVSMSMSSIWDQSSAGSRAQAAFPANSRTAMRSEEHTSELQSLMRISYAVFCLKKTKQNIKRQTTNNNG